MATHHVAVVISREEHLVGGDGEVPGEIVFGKSVSSQWHSDAGIEIAIPVGLSVGITPTGAWARG